MAHDLITQLSKQISELDETLLKLYKHMEKRFDTIEEGLASKTDKADLDRLQVAVDRVLKNQETEHAERLAIGSQFDRHDYWIHQLARKTYLKLSHE